MIRRLTVDYNRGRGAASLGHDVAGDAGVVSRVGESGLWDDELVIVFWIDGGVVFEAQRLLVFQPLHLKTRECEIISGRREKKQNRTAQ